MALACLHRIADYLQNRFNTWILLGGENNALVIHVCLSFRFERSSESTFLTTQILLPFALWLQMLLLTFQRFLRFNSIPANACQFLGLAFPVKLGTTSGSFYSSLLCYWTGELFLYNSQHSPKPDRHEGISHTGCDRGISLLRKKVR